MNLIQLEYYVATIEYGSYAQAGKAHFVSPQAVSKAVGDLEKELGVQLLSRKSNSIVVTELGSLFAIKAKEVLNSAKDLTSIAQSALAMTHPQKHISIAVGTQPFRSCALTTEQQKRLTSGQGGQRFSFLFSSDDSCLSALSHGFAEAAIIAGRSNHEGQTNIKLAETSIRIAMWDNHPLASSNELHISDLSTAPIARPYSLTLIFDIIQQHLNLFHLHPSYQDVAPTFESHVRFMQENYGVVLVHGEAIGLADDHIVVKSIQESEAIPVPICLVYQDETLSPETLATLYSSIRN